MASVSRKACSRRQGPRGFPSPGKHQHLLTGFPTAGLGPGGSNASLSPPCRPWAEAGTTPSLAVTTAVRLQMLSVTEQLDAGVRYLDLRVAHMRDGSEKNLHFVHMVYTTALVEVRGRGGCSWGHGVDVWGSRGRNEGAGGGFRACGGTASTAGHTRDPARGRKPASGTRGRAPF